MPEPAQADALAITRALRTHAGMDGRRLAEQIEELCRAAAEPIDAADVHSRIRRMIDEAELFVSRIPSDAVGVLFLEGRQPVEPDLDRLEQYERQSGAVGGVWPSSPEISRAMLENYDRQPRSERV